MMMATLALLAGSLTISGCGFPSAGPTPSQLEASTGPALDLYLVRVTPPVARLLTERPEDGFPPSLRLAEYRANVALRAGDLVSVSIYETGGSPLFGAPGQRSPSGGAPGEATPQSSSASQSATLPAQIIEPGGHILIPFVGRVPIAGRTPSQAAEEIAERLSTQTIGPQVIVSLLNQNSSAVTVGGEVNRAGLVPLTLRGERLLDVVAQAGGPKFPATELDVRIIRGRTVATIPMQQVLTDPADNLAMRPNDSVVVMRNPKTFVVMGAAMKVAQYSMDTERVTLAEGIARAGGTIDTVGNLAGIYLLRNEPAPFARSIMSADTTAVDSSFTSTEATRLMTAPRVQMVYRVDLTQAGGYFAAQNLTLRNKDIILVSNAEATQAQKVLTLLRSITGMYFDVSRAGAIYVSN